MSRTQPYVIPKEKIKEVKSWRLPYWTDKPVWESERVNENIRQRSRVKIFLPEKPVAAPVVEEKSVVVSEDIHTLPNLPTAEELETIRREAYNEGLEQGLVEGRQQGHQEGFAQGRQEGQEEGLEAGTNEGYQAGFSQGEEAGQAKAQADVNMVVMRLERIFDNLNSHISERDQQLPQVLSQLVVDLCQQIVEQELKQGAENIEQLVQQALAQLPEGEQHIKIFVGPDDAKHLQASMEATGAKLNYQVDKQLPAGSCRVESAHSLVEYSVTERMQQLLQEVQQQMLEVIPSEPLESEPLQSESLATESEHQPDYEDNNHDSE